MHSGVNGARQDTVTVCFDVEQISGINIRDQEYVIDFWLTMQYRKDSPFYFDKQLQVREAKRTKITLVDTNDVGKEKDSLRVRLEVSCTMAHNWETTAYPFDAQQLKIQFYNAVFDSSQLILKADGHGAHHVVIYPNLGWKWDENRTAGAVSSLIDEVPSDEYNSHSILCYTLNIHRGNTFFLFLKLFIGMYVAFFVAFTALYIRIDHHEPRFGLPVGALFAAIANKYIVEAILPQSPDYTLVDWLHSFTFVAILLIIASSAISLRLSEVNLDHVSTWRKGIMRWVDEKGAVHLLVVYFALNVILVALWK
jgi:hypothetical protein